MFASVSYDFNSDIVLTWSLDPLYRISRKTKHRETVSSNFSFYLESKLYGPDRYMMYMEGIIN